MPLDSHNKRAHILDLLARGAAPKTVCELADVTPAYISQLESEEDFALQLQEKRAQVSQDVHQRAERAARIYEKTQNLEEQILNNLTKSLTFMRPQDQMRLLSVVSAKKPPPDLAPVQQNNSTQIAVMVQVPASMAPQFVVNNKKELVGLRAGATTQPFAPMSSEGLSKLAAAQREKLTSQTKSSEQLLQMFNSQDEKVIDHLSQSIEL